MRWAGPTSGHHLAAAPVVPPALGQDGRGATLTGTKRTDAVQKVLSLGLNVRPPLGRRSGQPKDRVARQVPLAGSQVLAGAEVVLATYCRPKPCPSPPPGHEIYDPCSCATRT